MKLKGFSTWEKHYQFQRFSDDFATTSRMEQFTFFDEREKTQGLHQNWFCQTNSTGL